MLYLATPRQVHDNEMEGLSWAKATPPACDVQLRLNGRAENTFQEDERNAVARGHTSSL